MLKTINKINIKEIEGMKWFEEELDQFIRNSSQNIYDICKNNVLSGGKRIRPALLLSSSLCFGPLVKEAVMASVACECIHMASLVHDDIIDLSHTRRNKPTIHIEHGNHVGVLVGDFLFAKAFEVLSQYGLFQSLEILVDAISKMCDGEIVQAKNKFNIHQTKKDYYERIYKKTGVLLAACTQIGGIIGGASITEVKALKLYGENVGYAYQIIDDILDFTGNEKVLGKPIGADLKEGNITLPIIKLMENEGYKEWIEEMIKKDEIENRYTEIVQLLKEHYILQKTYDEAIYFIDQARKNLESIKDSSYKYFLMEITEQMIKRKK
ncbi:polyprenyl synthetase family protein [Inediibacterium massiliense]|uniref:polyprenyl synthetase family protein n=1 Tax=Inediibacterium massiliense TaxID=1658111 RepID=UPI0006B617A9|nr:polyprenyl synthetase family protein [Inediibacterium massiliense]